MQYHDDILYWLMVLRLPRIGLTKLHRLLDVFSSPVDLFNSDEASLVAAGLSVVDAQTILKADSALAEKDLQWARATETHLITLADSEYPVLLRELNDAPVVLFLQGDKSLLNRPQIGMVGSRHPTHDGKKTAHHFAASLAESGLAVTSGLALGVDAACHQGALSVSGSTLAVLGSGLKCIYPRSHLSLAEQIKREGALISEFLPDSEPLAHHFPRRNRIISGLSLGIVVVEAALRSGSLITARFAMEQGREVFAIPSSIHNTLARGCHLLIRQGAKLVETVQDIIEELGSLYAAQEQSLVTKPVSALPSDLAPDLKNILACIDNSSTALDTIIARSGLTAAEVSSMLLSLELRELIKFVSGGCCRI